MKRYMVPIFFIITLAISFLNTYATKIYIENHYGATIKFKTGSPDSNAPEIRVDNQERVEVGEASTIPGLSIRTTGMGSSMVSYFTDLNPQLVEISSHKGMPKNQNKDAIILIKPSRSYQNWNIEIHWETSDKQIEDFKEFEKYFEQSQQEREMRAFAARTQKFAEQQRKQRKQQPSPDFSMAELKLTNIMSGALGDEYAEKARAINDYDYTNAIKKGLQNLRTHLLKRIDETLKPTYSKYVGRTTEWIAPGLATEQELKENIDMLYRSLQRYKTQN